MAKLFRTLSTLVAAGFLAAGAGFLVFADTVRTTTPTRDPRADAIVVLTGDEERISTGVRLMMEGRARRLLISGVHPTTRIPTELKRRIGGNDAAREAVVHCCIDIGHAAVNTSGNADEARQWVRGNGFESVIVVTSDYHMLRGLTEFARAMPDTQLVAYPVATSRSLRLDGWWRHWPTARLLAGEYVKFVGSAGRLALARLLTRTAPATGPGPSRNLPSASASIRSGQ